MRFLRKSSGKKLNVITSSRFIGEAQRTMSTVCTSRHRSIMTAIRRIKSDEKVTKDSVSGGRVEGQPQGGGKRKKFWLHISYIICCLKFVTVFMDYFDD